VQLSRTRTVFRFFAELARAVYAQERYEEAERLTEESERLAGTADVRSQITFRAVRGQGPRQAAPVLARRSARP
jgi:hypothetical protein